MRKLKTKRVNDKAWRLKRCKKWASLIRKGECLSEEYVRSNEDLIWKCERGHIWATNAKNILTSKSWCGICSRKNQKRRKRKDKNKIWHLRRCQKYASLIRKGKCLSENYVRSSENMKWKCERGHIWDATPNGILTKRKAGKRNWCGECANINKSYSIKEIKNWLKKERNAELLSVQYKNCDKKLKIKCSFGHVFDKCLTEMLQGSFCPNCSSGIGERICIFAFEEIFNVPFNKTRPDDLLSEKGNPMELDGYAEFWWNGKFIKVAFEFQGEQHEKHFTFFHKSQNDFEKVVKRDEYKQKWCAQNDIILIQIPCEYAKRKIKKLISFLCGCFKQNGLIFENSSKIDIENVLAKAWKSPQTEAKFSEIRNVVEEKGGELLSNEYIGCQEKIFVNRLML